MKLLWHPKAREAAVRQAAAAEPRETSYIDEFLGAFDRTEEFGLETPAIRLLAEKPCLHVVKVMPLIQDFYTEHDPKELIGQTLHINLTIQERIYDQLGIPTYLTTGWITREGKKTFWHDSDKISQFLTEGLSAWTREGVPFHIWLTTPAVEILDLTFALNLGWAASAAECANLVIYRPTHSPTDDPIYQPTLIGDDFYLKTGAIV